MYWLPFRPVFVFIMVASVIFSVHPAQSAPRKATTDLSGQYGKVRGRLPKGRDDACAPLVRAYKAASGHSAYAQSQVNWELGYYVCGVALNRPTVEDAEKRALAQCQAAMKKWKYLHHGRCRVHASK